MEVRVGSSKCVRWFAACVMAACAALGLQRAAAAGEVDVSLFTIEPVVTVGETIAVEVVISSVSPSNQLVSAVQMIFAWDPQEMQLVGHSQQGAVNLLFSGFPADPYNINEANPPQNGLGMYQAWAPLGNPISASPQGTLLTTLLFEALEPAESAAIDILPTAGSPEGHTIVFDGTTPNTNITGALFGTEVTIISACPADLTGDGEVGAGDVLLLLADWGRCPPVGEGNCAADLDGDGTVGVADLLLLLSLWGKCP